MGWGDSLGGFGKSCGPPYTESMDHEFEPDSGTWPGGVDASHYCKHCGVVGEMHGGGQGGGAGGQPGQGDQGGDPDGEGDAFDKYTLAGRALKALDGWSKR